jgi:DNA methylase
MIDTVLDRTTSPSPQDFRNGEIHDWYRTVWGYSDHLVARLLEDFERPSMRVLDPFCGSGTTLVECMKHGIDSAGIDANPVSCLAAKVKTNWSLQPERLKSLLKTTRRAYERLAMNGAHRTDPTYQYLESSGMINRGWIGVTALRKVLALKAAIAYLPTNASYKQALQLALVDTLVFSASNVKFGPELYCGEPRRKAHVLEAFSERVLRMADDLLLARSGAAGTVKSRVIEGDARNATVFAEKLGAPFSHIITSPPYPAEHDYTRNSRLELALLESVCDVSSLQAIKRRMVRSHTKGIYVTDADGRLVANNKRLTELVACISERAAKKSHGFAKLYGRVTLEYFGGMVRHLRSIRGLLQRDAVLCYVVGDQSSYLQVPIPTAKILGELSEEHGYDVIEVRHWRDRITRSHVKVIVENILVMKKRG